MVQPAARVVRCVPALSLLTRRESVSTSNYRLITKTQEPLSSNIIVNDDRDVLWRNCVSARVHVCSCWYIGRLDWSCLVSWRRVVKNKMNVWTQCTDTWETDGASVNTRENSGVGPNENLWTTSPSLGSHCVHSWWLLRGRWIPRATWGGRASSCR